MWWNCCRSAAPEAAEEDVLLKELGSPEEVPLLEVRPQSYTNPSGQAAVQQFSCRSLYNGRRCLVSLIFKLRYWCWYIKFAKPTCFVSSRGWDTWLKSRAAKGCRIAASCSICLTTLSRCSLQSHQGSTSALCQTGLRATIAQVRGPSARCSFISHIDPPFCSTGHWIADQWKRMQLRLCNLMHWPGNCPFDKKAVLDPQPCERGCKERPRSGLKV